MSVTRETRLLQNRTFKEWIEYEILYYNDK